MDSQEPMQHDLYLRVRLAFISNGTSFAEWCRENGVCRPYATRCLQYVHDGEKARELRNRIALAAGVEAQ